MGLHLSIWGQLIRLVGGYALGKYTWVVGKRVLGRTIVSNTGGVSGRGGDVGSLGVFPMPSKSANAGVSVAIGTTITTLRSFSNAYTNSTTNVATSTVLHKTENGSNIVASLVFHNFTRKLGSVRRISNGGLTTTLKVNISTTCGTIVGPARKAVLAITEVTCRTNVRTTGCSESIISM